MATVWTLLIYVSAAALIALLIAFVGLCMYVYHVHRQYAHIPGPPRNSFFFGNLPFIFHQIEKVGCCYEDLAYEFYLKHGNVFVVWFMFHPIVTIYHPQDVKKALITLNLPKSWALYKNFGFVFGQRFVGYGLVSNPNHDTWKRHRACINPAFHRKYLKEMIGCMNEKCDKLLEHLRDLADGQSEVRMVDMFQRATTDIIGKVAFDMDINSVNEPHSTFPEALKVAVDGIIYQLLHPFHKINIFSFDYQDDVIEAIKYLRDIAKKIIDQRLQALHAAEEMPVDILTQIVQMSQNDTDFSMDDLIDEFLTLFIAGQDTTANTMAFMLLEVSRNPSVLERLRQEVGEVLGSKQSVSYEDLSNLKYLGCVLMETLRLYSVAALTARVTQETTEFGGYTIPAKTEMYVPMHGYHKHQDFWTDPEQFNPDRFIDGVCDSPTRGCTFMPFSAGPRNCIGQFLAQFEIKILFARLLQNFNFKLSPGQTGRIQPRLSLYPRDGIIGTLELL